MDIDFSPIDSHVTAIVQHAQTPSMGLFGPTLNKHTSDVVQCAQGWLRITPIWVGDKCLENHVHVELDEHDYGHEEDWLRMYRDPQRANTARREYVCVPLDVVATLVARRGGLR